MIPKIQNIKKKIIFHTFPKISSNNIFSPKTRSKEKETHKN